MKVVVHDPALSKYRSILCDSAGDSVTLVFAESLDVMAEEMVDAEVFVGPSLPKDIGDSASSLRFIQSSITGLEGFNPIERFADVTFAVVCHHERSVAEHVMMATLALQRRLITSHLKLRKGIWDSTFQLGSAFRPLSTLTGKRMCLYGFGGIGREVARLAGHFGVDVTAVRGHPGSDDESLLAEVGSPDTLTRMAADTDILVVAVPLTSDTRGRVDIETFRAMKSSSILVNVARGPVVSESALFRALSEGMIAGAAIDVWYQYPTGDLPTLPASYPFWELDNIIMTPHNSGMTEETFQCRADYIGENLRLFAAGKQVDGAIIPGAQSDS